MPKDNYDNKTANIRDLVWDLAGGFPTTKFYERHIKSYLRQLEPFTIDVIERGLELAKQNRQGQGYGDPSFMPTAEHCRQACKIIEFQGPALAIGEASDPEHHLPADHPITMQINAWAAESKELGLGPDDQCSIDVVRDRFKIIMALASGVGK